ncbi:TPR domain protein, partial [mine drainage metagenome]
ARIMAQTGRSDVAADEFRHVLQRDPRNADAWFGLSYLDDCYLKPIDGASIADVLSARSVDDPAREKLYFALAKAFEVQQDYERAFDYFRRANEFGRRRAPWNPERAHARVESIKRAFSELTMPTVTGDYGSEAIFIVSLPRSGSTLLEQILASHPDVEGANEIQSLALTIEAESRSRGLPFPGWVSEEGPQDWNRLGQEYLSRAEHWRHGKPRFTDKNLENWLIAGAALLMLPGTRVILLQRDFVETCLACYRQSFGNSRGFTCDLEAMADYCS